VNDPKDERIVRLLPPTRPSLAQRFRKPPLRRGAHRSSATVEASTCFPTKKAFHLLQAGNFQIYRSNDLFHGATLQLG
jgi:hypothetical protein